MLAGACIGPLWDCRRMDPLTSPLLTDLYQLNMVQAYLDNGMGEIAVFEFFSRRLPKQRRFLMAAGLEQALSFLETVRFGVDEIEWLAASGRFDRRFLDYVAAFRFSGDVDAMAEGTIFFADEPILRVTAPIAEAQLVETRLINLLHLQSLIAAKAARMVLAAEGRVLIDFGLRRAHGAEAGLHAARAAYIAGFAGSASVLAAPAFGVPLYGTMAHSYVQAHASESEAFLSFARSRPRDLVLLIDSYDTEAGARRVVSLAPRLASEGIAVRGVRLELRRPRLARAPGPRHPRRGRPRGGSDLRQRRHRRAQDRPVRRRRRANRRLRRRHQPGHLAGRAGARLRLQAAGLRRPPPAQTL